MLAYKHAILGPLTMMAPFKGIFGIIYRANVIFHILGNRPNNAKARADENSAVSLLLFKNSLVEIVTPPSLGLRDFTLQ